MPERTLRQTGGRITCHAELVSASCKEILNGSLFVQISNLCTKYKKNCAYLDNMHKVAENIVDD